MIPARRSSGTLAETTRAPPARDNQAARLQGAVCKLLFMPINYLLTITPQHCPNKESPRALVRRRKLIVHLGGGQRLAGLQGVTSCRHLA